MRIVIPSVQYADFLAVTLPAWKTLFPAASIVVVTAPGDHETGLVAKHYGVRLCVTDAWYSNGAKLDKGSALNEGFGFTGDRVPPPNDGERCLSIDADVYPFGRLPEERLAMRTIYGCPRYLCRNREELEAHRRGETRRRDLPLLLARYRGDDAPQTVVGADKRTTRGAALSCLGYFQLWRHCGYVFAGNRTAGKCDIVFRNLFGHRAVAAGFYVLHLGDVSRRNWGGRTLPRWPA